MHHQSEQAAEVDEVPMEPVDTTISGHERGNLSGGSLDIERSTATYRHGPSNSCLHTIDNSKLGIVTSGSPDKEVHHHCSVAS